MKDMPKSATKWYRSWIVAFPESWDSRNLERFYMFVSVLLGNVKRQRSRYWLEENLKADCKKLSVEDIEIYCDIYEHIRDFKNVWKSQQAKLVAQSVFENNMKEARKNMVNKSWQTKKIKTYLSLIILVIIVIVGVFKFPQILTQINLLALLATLAVLIWYAYDTRRIANQTIDSNLRPIVLRSGLNIDWKFRPIKANTSNRSNFIEIENLKNIAMDIEGYIILDKRQYKLLFGRESFDNKPENKVKKFEFVDSFKWQWLPQNSKVFASFDNTKFTEIRSENELYLIYKDIEGNTYFTKEDRNFSQVTGRL